MSDPICLAPKSSFSVLTFPTNHQKVRPRRAKFNPTRRNEVAVVRKKGCCLRCRLLKIKCSGNDPCETCIKLRQTMEYQLENFNSTDDLYHPLNLVRFSTQLKWIMGSLDAGRVSWQDNLIPTEVDDQIYMVFYRGFTKVFRDNIPPEITRDFQTMLLSFAILPCQASTTGNLEFNRAIKQAGIRASQRLLERLDHLLSSLYNGKVSTTVPITVVAEAHFILLYGTLLAIYYATDPGSSQSFNILDSETGSYRPSTLWNAMREHLYSMLAHHLVFLGSRLDLAFSSLERPISLQASKLPVKAPPLFVTFNMTQSKRAAQKTTDQRHIYIYRSCRYSASQGCFFLGAVAMVRPRSVGIAETTMKPTIL
ncbi:hypothetical protein V495_07579 [Pseudogymnoascus sp. VKM F-4514 (FW-929)]|nr:hypothetical protein V495_07579 [Pseudogymnoascus sp. VKM F-4514 (FW-929)]KFY52073.1 hypothetical protein V497_08657 [Pseudogymnoascus sp. VKM F-4516 (FW-969)]